MDDRPRIIALRTTPGNVSKGLIAIPKRLRGPFPKRGGQVVVLLDDEDTPRARPYSPYESSTRQCRIGGLHGWYRRHRLRGGEQVLIAVVDEAAGVYRLTLGRHQQEREAREQLYAARTDVQAEAGLSKLASVCQEPEREVALAELRRLARQQREEKRRRMRVAASGRPQNVPANIRVLLKTIHQGKCQVCGFTFEKRDGGPYFEMHHVERDMGNHLWNLLLVCPSCHAQFEHADVGAIEKRGNWVVAVVINADRKEVYQPLLRRRADAVAQALRVSWWVLLLSHLALRTWRAA